MEQITLKGLCSKKNTPLRFFPQTDQLTFSQSKNMNGYDISTKDTLGSFSDLTSFIFMSCFLYISAYSDSITILTTPADTLILSND